MQFDATDMAVIKAALGFAKSRHNNDMDEGEDTSAFEDGWDVPGSALLELCEKLGIE